MVESHPLNVFAVYTTDWAKYRNITNDSYAGQPVVRPAWCKAYGYTPSHLDASLFTHIIYAFAKVDAATYAVVSYATCMLSCRVCQWSALTDWTPDER